MIPIGDDIPNRTFPFMTIVLIIANIAVFVYELSLGAGARSFIGAHGVIPKDVMTAVTRADVRSLPVIFMGSLFIHSGWFHLAGNMLYLWVFGNNIEDKLGHFKYIGFYAIAGSVAMGMHVLSMPGSINPAIGASGAIAGVLGAYLVMFPRARVFIVIPLFVFFPVVGIRAVYVLSFWFLQQLISGAGAIVDPATAAGVAWWAHIGGFGVGMIMAWSMTRARTQKVRWH